jgi:hypothetical protein
LQKGGIPLFGKEGLGEIFRRYVFSIKHSLVRRERCRNPMNPTNSKNSMNSKNPMNPSNPMNSMSRFVWFIFVLFVIGTPALVHAQLEDILSKFKADISVQEEANSNIDLTPNRIKRDDYITTVSPRLRFSTSPKSPVTSEFLKTPTAEQRYGIDLDVGAGFNFYAKNHDDNYISLDGTLNAWYALTQRLKFQVRDYLIRSDEIREPDYSSTAIPGQYLVSRTNRREPYIRNVFEPSVQYQFGRENVIALNYQNNVYNTQSRTGEDSMENFVNPKLTYWFDIRNGVSFEYGLILGNFQQSPDLVGNMAAGRYTYRFNPRTSIFGDYTQLWRNFEKPGVDYIVYRPSIGIEHAFSPNLSARVQMGYYRADPQEGSAVDGPFYDLLITQRAGKTTYTLSSQGGYTEDFFDAQNRGFTKYYRVIGSISHQLLQRMDVGVFSSFEWIKFYGGPVDPTAIGAAGQIDRIWAVGGNASYRLFKWLALSLEASHRENHSNIDNADYGEYRGILRITATY